MSRNQQILILALAILISVGLVIGAYMKKRPGAFRRDTPVESTREQPQQKFPAPSEKKRPLRQPAEVKPPHKIYKPHPVVAMSAAVREVFGQMRILSVSITAAIMRNRMTYADLEQLDFAGGTDNPSDYAVFNPRGVLMFRGMMSQWVTQGVLDEVTTEPGQSIWYSLRRAEEAGDTIDVLYAVIPNPASALCAATRLHFSLSDKLKFASGNGQVVADREGFIDKQAYKGPSCLFTPDKEAYWFYPLRTRLLRAGSKSWQAVP